MSQKFAIKVPYIAFLEYEVEASTKEEACKILQKEIDNSEYKRCTVVGDVQDGTLQDADDNTQWLIHDEEDVEQLNGEYWNGHRFYNPNPNPGGTPGR